MGTKVIDKLRIQGSPAPRTVLEPRRTKSSHFSFPDTSNANQFIVHHGYLQGTPNSLASHSHPSSAASRRLDFLHRVQHANRGLTAADFLPPSRETLPATQFLLRGKPAKGDYDFDINEQSEYQRVGHYKTSAKEVYRARNRVPSERGYYGDTRDITGFFRAVRSADYDFNSAGHCVPGSSPGERFYLGPQNSAPAKKSLLLYRPRLQPGENTDLKRGYTWREGLAGRQLQPPGEEQHDAYDYFDHSEPSFHANRTPLTMPDIHPHINTSFTRRKQQWHRTSTKDLTEGNADPTLLNQCLSVQPSQRSLVDPADLSPRELVNLKHFNHHARKEDCKINYNNPYRNMKTKERKALTSCEKYVFSSVDSYIHFNKIYPRLDVQNSFKKTLDSKIPMIPQMNGFSPHCTDTVLLKMMFEMNQPKSVKSSSKYSDVAVHKDLDEFLIVGTPSVSRSPSVQSKRFTDRKAKSLVSSGVDMQVMEVDEDEELDEQTQKDGADDEEVSDILPRGVQGIAYNPRPLPVANKIKIVSPSDNEDTKDSDGETQQEKNTVDLSVPTATKSDSFLDLVNGLHEIDEKSPEISSESKDEEPSSSRGSDVSNDKQTDAETKNESESIIT